jgi:hypothetical protein
MILSEDDLSRVDVRDYDLCRGSTGVKDLAVGELAASVIRGKLADYLRQRRQRHVIAVRKDTGGPVRDVGGTPVRLAGQADRLVR